MLPTVSVTDDHRIRVDPPDGLAFTLTIADAARLGGQLIGAASLCAIRTDLEDLRKASDEPTR